VTPGPESRCPEGSGVTIVGGTRCAQRPADHRRSRGSSTRTGVSCNCLPSGPLLRPPGVVLLLSLPGVSVTNIF
jgi:hypothetical protein